MEIIKYFRKLFVSASNTKGGRRIISLAKWLIVLFLGAAIYAILDKVMNSQSPWKELATLFAGILALGVSAFMAIKEILHVELTTRQIKYEEQKIQRETIDEGEIGEKIATKVTELIRQKTKQFPNVFDERTKHYQEEKQLLAKAYINFLGQRIDAILKDQISEINAKSIILLFDSGTTISPILKELAKNSLGNGFHWTKNKRVQIHTNNIRGIQHILNLKEGDGRYGDLPFNCKVMPGELLSPYEAIVGLDTINYIRKLSRLSSTYVIAISTGNYLLFNQFQNKFMPIARAGYHPHVKTAMYDCANEVHIVAPLGKILINVSSEDKSEDLHKMLDTFNKNLDYKEDTNDKTERPYHLVSPKLLRDIKYNNDSGLNISELRQSDMIKMGSWVKKSILFTTSRESDNNSFLYDHSTFLKNRLSHFSLSMDMNTPYRKKTGQPFIWTTDFDGLPKSLYHQIEQEIPHINLRKKEIFDQYFFHKNLDNNQSIAQLGGF